MDKNTRSNMSPNTASGIQAEIEFLLTSALPEENLNSYQIEIVGTTKKGEGGYIGDIYFVNLKSKNKKFNLVLKCGKPCEILRKKAPIKNAFDNEIYMYKVVFPAFRKFEIQRNIDDVFDSLSKCYGTFTSPNKEIIVLDNLRSLGYGLSKSKLPLPRNYVETILKEYGKWHAISAAMQEQEPAKFQELTNNLFDIWSDYCAVPNYDRLFLNAVQEIVKIWQNDIDEVILKEWKTFMNHVRFYIRNSRKTKYFNVVTHGDNWNNNYMFQTTDNGIKVVMLDWQMAAFTSPIIDLSCFIYSVISEQDLQDFDDLLKLYYKSFAQHLKKLGSNPDTIYSYTNLLNDWKRYGRIGLIYAAFIINMTALNKDEIPDMAKSAENGEDLTVVFSPVAKDVDFVKKRTKGMIYHAVQRGFIQPIDDF